jgi:tRNA/rRNA methyltransferase
VVVSERAARQSWLEARGYKVIPMTVADVERDLATELAKVEASLSKQD